MKIISCFLLVLCCSNSWGFIPKASLILNRLSENAGNGYYQIEQEIQFPNGSDNLILKETWLIENENNMKLVVTGARDLKDLVFFSRTFTENLRPNFIERYFHMRNPDSLAQALVQLKIAPTRFLSKKTVRNLKDIDNEPENFVRLSRVGGVLTYALGVPQAPDQTPLSPGFWIEQDQFLLRKFRLPEQVEVSADRYSNYSRGLAFPRTRVVRWDQNQVTIQTISVQAKTKDAWKKFGLNVPSKLERLSGQAGFALIEEFYKRFR